MRNFTMHSDDTIFFSQQNRVVISSETSIYCFLLSSLSLLTHTKGRKFTSFAGEMGTPGLKNGAASQALFQQPNALAIDERNNCLLVCELLNERLRCIPLLKV